MSAPGFDAATLAIAPEVARARARHRAIVALETTLVTHGLPHPQGLDTARALEDDVHHAGATPATIGVLDGMARVGMTRAELERLAGTRGVRKLNPGNLAACVAQRASGSTTVAATMLLAEAAGLDVFATGGIGGVHRDVADSGDVSADLTLLARARVTVVCAGAKAILDLPKTRESLETLGVPVLGLGTDELPAFYRRSSGLPVDARFDDVAALADAVRAHRRLGGRGVLVVCPIPEADELPARVYDAAVARALDEAGQQQVRGRAVTPFVLERMRVHTDGASVRANLALLRNNARHAAALARALTRLDSA